MTAVPWLVAVLVLVLLEVISFNFVFASFAIGAAAAAVASGVSRSLSLQTAAFAIASVASLGLIRPTVLRHLYRRSDAGPTGIDKLIGRTVVTASLVDNEGGTVTVDGETWSARSDHGPIARGESVRITAIAGAIARVTRL